MSGNAPVPPPPPHSEPAQQPPVFQPRSQQPATPPAAPVPPLSAASDQQATAYQPAQPGYGQDQATAYPPAQPAYQPPAYQQQPAYQQPAYQAPPPAFAPGSGQQAAYQAPPAAPQPAYAPQPTAPQYAQPAPQQYPAQQAPQQYAAQQAPQQYQQAYAEQPPAAAAPGGRPGKRGGRLSPGWIAFIALDVILVGIVIAFAINLAGGASGEAPAEGPGTSAEAPAATPGSPAEKPGPVVVTGESVTTPSRNITCTIGEQGVSCGIAELATQPAPVDGCTGTTGYLVTLTSSGVEIPCVPTADQPTKAGDDVAVLDYDQAKTVGSFTCTSSKTGMRCADADTGKGFNVAKAGLSSF
ncbi:hypothetical protein [Oerskovia jenensis]|uniref:hypothetical protein n=1 Tax=Oerskovia jenensis TaxID=162169 RepID=UPI0036DDBB0B